MTKHTLPIRIYHEDTDGFGIVYHSNYINFAERARTEWLRELGIHQLELRDEGVMLVVRALHIDYLKPAKFDDLLRVESEVIETKKVSMKFSQKIYRDSELLASLEVLIASISPSGKVVRIPHSVFDAIPTPNYSHGSQGS